MKAQPDDAEDFNVLYEFTGSVGDLGSYLGAEAHSQEAFDELKQAKEIMEITERRVKELDNIESPRDRLLQEVDFRIWVEYRNGIHQALNHLANVEDIVQLPPDRILM
jgi:hypothetical protein